MVHPLHCVPHFVAFICRQMDIGGQEDGYMRKHAKTAMHGETISVGDQFWSTHRAVSVVNFARAMNTSWWTPPICSEPEVSDTNRIVCYDRDGKYQPLLSNIEATWCHVRTCAYLANSLATSNPLPRHWVAIWDSAMLCEFWHIWLHSDFVKILWRLCLSIFCEELCELCSHTTSFRTVLQTLPGPRPSWNWNWSVFWQPCHVASAFALCLYCLSRWFFFGNQTSRSWARRRKSSAKSMISVDFEAWSILKRLFLCRSMQRGTWRQS